MCCKNANSSFIFVPPHCDESLNETRPRNFVDLTNYLGYMRQGQMKYLPQFGCDSSQYRSEGLNHSEYLDLHE